MEMIEWRHKKNKKSPMEGHQPACRLPSFQSHNRTLRHPTKFTNGTSLFCPPERSLRKAHLPEAKLIKSSAYTVPHQISRSTHQNPYKPIPSETWGEEVQTKSAGSTQLLFINQPRRINNQSPTDSKYTVPSMSRQNPYHKETNPDRPVCLLPTYAVIQPLPVLHAPAPPNIFQKSVISPTCATTRAELQGRGGKWYHRPTRSSNRNVFLTQLIQRLSANGNTQYEVGYLGMPIIVGSSNRYQQIGVDSKMLPCSSTVH